MDEKAHQTPSKKIALQLLLPLFPSEATMINNYIGVQKRDSTVYYFNGSMQIFTHSQSDIDSFRYISSQFLLLRLL